MTFGSVLHEPGGITWPRLQGMPRNSWCVSFETECMTLNVHPFWRRGSYTQKKGYQNGTPGVLLVFLHMIPFFQRATLFSLILITIPDITVSQIVLLLLSFFWVYVVALYNLQVKPFMYKRPCPDNEGFYFQSAIKILPKGETIIGPSHVEREACTLLVFAIFLSWIRVFTW